MSTYRIRVELDHITPVIWREVQVPTDMPLPTLHLVVQEAFGWQNYHLHSFRRENAFGGVQVWQESPEMFDSPLPGTPSLADESRATVADLLPGDGAQATYEYDFGDSWEHTLTVLGHAAADDDAAHLLAGEHAGPPEDCGGVPGYLDLVETLTSLARDPQGPVEDWQRERVVLTFGRRQPSAILAQLDAFDLETTGARVRAVTAPVPELDDDLATAVAEAEARGSMLLTRMVRLARLDQRIDPDREACAAMMDPITWFLQRVGAEGLTLTSAGYLRPVDVQAVAERLNLREEWIGTFNREVQTPAVTDFREAIQRLGLVRKAKGRLSRTAAGKRLAEDPRQLWQHVAGRLPVGRTEFAKVAGLVVMLDLATQPVADPQGGRTRPDREPVGSFEYLHEQNAVAGTRLADAVHALGWQAEDGPLLGADVRREAALTLAVLTRCGVVPRFRFDVLWQPTDHGRQLLVAALRA
ncbi:MAG TPA: plasmid pRiA4b ORF-3 family protein [Beutenbergiaceae bacterium]|nr:plasmid pRiA4b ORF-3 family protein [Beutenbergiaceae bacterium]